MRPYKIHPDKYPELFKQHVDGKSIRQIAIDNGVEPPSITKIFKKCGKAIRPAKRYVYNHDYFKTLGPRQAYFLGLISADGYHDGKAKFEISLVESDAYILKELSLDLLGADELGTKSLNKQNKNWQDQKRLSLYSPTIITDIKSYGITNKKSLTLSWPRRIAGSEFVWHYIRGYFDGDGCVELKKNGHGTIYGEFSIVGSNEWIDGCVTFLNSLEINTNRTRLDKISELSTNKIENINRLYNRLYSNTNDLYLRRKKLKMEEVLHIKSLL